MKKSVKIRVLSLAVASLLLCGALTVAAVMGSPYEILKKALLDALTYRNVTMEARGSVTVNGEIYEEQKSSFIAGDESYLEYTFDKNGNPDGYRYYSEKLDIHPDYFGMDGTQWYSAYVKGEGPYSYSNNNYNSFAVLTPEDRKSTQMRFMELLADVLVGDLKNNITMSLDGGTRLIQGTLTEAQIPELVKAGIDVLIEEAEDVHYDWRETVVDGKYICEETRIKGGTKTVTVYKQDAQSMAVFKQKELDNNAIYDYCDGPICIDRVWYVLISPRELADSYTAPATREDYDGTDDPFDMPIKNLVINYAHGEAEIDEKGDMLAFDLNAKFTVTSIFGDTDVIEFNANVKFTDVGTSEASCPIPGAEQLLTPEYMKTRFNSAYGNVYFTLNEDGSINEGSVTTTYPGETERNNYYED